MIFINVVLEQLLHRNIILNTTFFGSHPTPFTQHRFEPETLDHLLFLTAPLPQSRTDFSCMPIFIFLLRYQRTPNLDVENPIAKYTSDHSDFPLGSACRYTAVRVKAGAREEVLLVPPTSRRSLV